MNTGTWNPWKVAAIGMALVMATALIVGIVVGGWYGPPSEARTVAGRGALPFPAAVARPTSSPMLIAHAPTTMSAVIAECDRYAARRTGQRDGTIGDENQQRAHTFAMAYSSCMSARGYN